MGLPIQGLQLGALPDAGFLHHPPVPSRDPPLKCATISPRPRVMVEFAVILEVGESCQP